jgi:hypothetical protein
VQQNVSAQVEHEVSNKTDSARHDTVLALQACITDAQQQQCNKHSVKIVRPIVWIASELLFHRWVMGKLIAVASFLGTCVGIVFWGLLCSA